MSEGRTDLFSFSDTHDRSSAVCARGPLRQIRWAQNALLHTSNVISFKVAKG